MYEKKFLNSPVLVSALNSLGAKGLWDFFGPYVDEWTRYFGRSEMKAIRNLFIARTSPFFGRPLRTELLFQSLETWRDGDLRSAHLSCNMKFERVDRLFKSLARMVWMIDNLADHAVVQIVERRFDYNLLRKMHIDLLSLDHPYVADDILRHVIKHKGLGPELAHLVRISIGRIALKELRRDGNWHKTLDTTAIFHVVDWLINAVKTDATWLSNVDAHGRPKKLMKFGSLEAMHAEAEKWMKRELEAAALAVAAEEETFVDDGGDFRLVRLTTTRGLDYESQAMRHCIGHGAYDELLEVEGNLFLSLRDRRNSPHITIHVRDNTIIQFSGKANSVPKPEYSKAALRLLNPKGIHFQKFDPITNLCREIRMPAVEPHLIWGSMA
jgi:hypothetical protein